LFGSRFFSMGTLGGVCACVVGRGSFLQQRH
jgi:hypothetical protein